MEGLFIKVPTHSSISCQGQGVLKDKKKKTVARGTTSIRTRPRYDRDAQLNRLGTILK